GGKFLIRPFSWRVGIIKEALRRGPIATEEIRGRDGEVEHVKMDTSGNGYPPPSAITKMTQSDYYSYPDVCYAEGWSLIYFLREIVPKNEKWNAKWGKILDTYFQTLKTEVNKETPLAPPTFNPDDGK